MNTLSSMKWPPLVLRGSFSQIYFFRGATDTEPIGMSSSFISVHTHNMLLYGFYTTGPHENKLQIAMMFSYCFMMKYFEAFYYLHLE